MGCSDFICGKRFEMCISVYHCRYILSNNLNTVPMSCVQFLNQAATEEFRCGLVYSNVLKTLPKAMTYFRHRFMACKSGQAQIALSMFSEPRPGRGGNLCLSQHLIEKIP